MSCFLLLESSVSDSSPVKCVFVVHINVETVDMDSVDVLDSRRGFYTSDFYVFKMYILQLVSLESAHAHSVPAKVYINVSEQYPSHLRHIAKVGSVVVVDKVVSGNSDTAY